MVFLIKIDSNHFVQIWHIFKAKQCILYLHIFKLKLLSNKNMILNLLTQSCQICQNGVKNDKLNYQNDILEKYRRALLPNSNFRIWLSSEDQKCVPLAQLAPMHSAKFIKYSCLILKCSNYWEGNPFQPKKRL